MILNNGDISPICGCVVNGDNMPQPNDSVDSLALVCSHGMSEVMKVSDTENMTVSGNPIKLHNAFDATVFAAMSWLGEENPGEHLRSWVFNPGTEAEFFITMSDNGPVIQWNRCQYLSTEEEIMFHSALDLLAWGAKTGGQFGVINLN